MDAVLLSVLIFFARGFSDATDVLLTSSSDTATVGVDFTFTCLSNARAIYFTRDNTNECLIIGSYPNGTCSFYGDYNINFKHNCNNKSGVYILTIPSSFDIETLHGSIWRCSSPLDLVSSETIQLYVNVPITQVFVTTIPTDKNPIEVISGKNQMFNCKTNAGRPSSRIQWYISGTDITGSATPQADICNAGCNGKVISSSVLTYSGKIADNGNILYCTAINTNGQSVRSENKSIVIWYIPDSNPVIIQDPAGGIIAGNNVTLQCIVSGGNPLATLSWNCQGYKINNTIGSTASYSVVITVDKTYNNRECICSATHSVLSYRPSMSQTLIVFYVPEGEPSIQQMPDHGIINRHTVKLTCLVSGGNPLAILSWDCKGNTTNLTIATTSSYSVEFIVDRNDNNRFCICAAKHIISSYRPNVKHKLVVYYKPFLDNTRPHSPSHISATENNILQITLAINANPTPTIEWTFKAETDCNLSSIVSNTTTNGLLTSSSILFDKVHSSDFGKYTFTANNTVGIFLRGFVVIKEASSKQETCAHTQESTGIFVVGIVTLVVGLLSLSASVIFIVRNNFKNKTLKSSNSDEYTGVQRGNPAFTDEYNTLQSEIESRPHQEQSSNTYEECERKTEAHPYSNVNTMAYEPKHPQEHGINTYEECGRNFEAHAYNTSDK